MFRRLYLLLISISCTLSVFGAELPLATSYQLFNLNTSNGLSASSVQSVIEGRNGAIWISTKLGVDRYNGQRVQHYAMPQVGNKARTNFMMYRLLCDEDGSMLVYDNKGAIYIYNEALDAFVLLYDLNAIVGSDIIPNGMMTDGKGGFWLALNQGFCHFSSADSLQWIERNIAFNHITQYGDRLLVGNAEGLYAYTVSGEKQEKICNNNDIRSSYFDPQSQLLWIGTFNEGLLVYNSRRKSLCNWPPLSRIPTTPVRVIRVLDDHTLLVGTDGSGVFAISRDGREVRLLFDETQGSGLQGKGIYDICVDSQGNLWMGSYTGGVDIAIASEGLFETVKHFDKDENSLISDNVNDIVQTADSCMWYATEAGVSICDLRTRQWHHALRDVAVLNLCQTSQGKMLAATYGKGVYQVERDGTATLLYSLQEGSLRSNYVYRLLEEADGTLWIGCLDAPMVQIKDGKSTLFPVNVVQCITKMPCGDLAVGTAYGWYRIPVADPAPQLMFTHRDFPTQEYNFSIESLLFRSDDEVWLGTDGGGIYLYRISTHEVIQHFTTADGLPSDFISTLAYDRSGDILVSDVMMPGMHGDELCRTLKNDPQTSWLPVILLSGNADRDSMLGGLEAGADDYVVKPFDETILRQRIDTLLSNHRCLSKYYLKHSMQLASGLKETIEPTEEDTLASDVASASQMDAADLAFVEKATRLVLDNIADVDYGIDQLCSDLAMSRTLFYGRIKTLTSHTPQEFIRLIRLERAATLIREGRSILEVSVETGFINVKYFSTVFKKHFGVSPSKYE